MVRTQILLTDEQARALRQCAASEGRSMADIVRESVEARLRERRGASRADLRRRSLAALGRYRSGVADLGSRHDAHLGEAFGR